MKERASILFISTPWSVNNDPSAILNKPGKNIINNLNYKAHKFSKVLSYSAIFLIGNETSAYAWLQNSFNKNPVIHASM